LEGFAFFFALLVGVIKITGLTDTSAMHNALTDPDDDGSEAKRLSDDGQPGLVKYPLLTRTK
jgi:hypothetical protein